MSFLLYLIGFVVLVTGLAWIATVAGIAQTYVLGGVVVLLVMGIFTALTSGGARDAA